jgi:phosphohistidine phosphatase
MDIILVRHAEAGSRDPNSWPDDGARPVTAEGRKKHIAVAKAMRQMGIEFEFLVTSPLVRARETAEILAEMFGWNEPPQESPALGPDCTTAGVVKLLAKFPPTATVCLVGHEPSFSQLAASLISKSGDASIELKKSGVIGIAFDGAAAVGAGRLKYLWRPGQLRRVK